MLPKDEFKIIIPQAAMEETKAACSAALYEASEKHMNGLGETLLRFIQKDLRVYLYLSSIALCITLFLSYYQEDKIYVVWTISMYFGFLSFLSIYETLKNYYFKTMELFSAVYIHPGRCFLFKLAAMALLELVQSLIFYLVVYHVAGIYVNELILCGLIPIYLIQILLLYIYDRVHSLGTAIALYIVLFAIYEVVVLLFDIPSMVTAGAAICLWVSVVAIFTISFWREYHQVAKGKLYYGNNT